MTGYELLVDELEKTSAPNVGQMCAENGADGSENIFVKIKQLEEEYAMPSAFDKFGRAHSVFLKCMRYCGKLLLYVLNEVRTDRSVLG